MPRKSAMSPRKEENDPLAGKSPDPLKVYSERDLAREFESLVKDLRNKDHDAWLKRNAALRTIQALILGGAAEMESFLPLIKESKDYIADALGDLRSVLVKEACTTVSMLAEVLGNSLAPLADILLPVLLKQLPVTILVISEASHHCLRSFFKHVHSARMVPKIVEGCKAKQTAVRSKCIEYFLLILQSWSIADLEKSIEAIEAALQSCLSDAQSDVRANARQCVLVYCERFEERGKRFMSSLDPNTQKKIVQEGQLELERRDNPLGVNKTGSLSNLNLGSNDDRSSRPKSGLGRDSSGAGELKVEKLPFQSKRKSLSTGLPSDSLIQKVEVLPQGMSKTAERVRSPLSPSSLPAPLQISNQANIQGLSSAVPESSKSLGLPKRILLERKPFGVKLDVDSTNSGDAFTPDEANCVRTIAKRVSRPVSLDEDVDVSGIIEKINNSLWSIRETALEELRASVESGSGIRSANQQLAKIADLVGERLSDAHYRVQIAALGLVSCLAQQFTASLTPHVESLATRVIQRLPDKKEGVNKTAREVLTTLTGIYGLEYLVPSIIKALETPQPLVRSTVLDYVIASMPVFLLFLQSNHCQARILCTRLWHLSVDRALDVRRLSSNILIQFRGHGMAMYVYDSASKLPNDTQVMIRKAMSAHIPDFDRELNTYLRTRKLPSDICQVPLPPVISQSQTASEPDDMIVHLKSESMCSWGETEVAPKAQDYSGWLDNFSQATSSSATLAIPEKLTIGRDKSSPKRSSEVFAKSNSEIAEKKVMCDDEISKMSNDGRNPLQVRPQQDVVKQEIRCERIETKPKCIAPCYEEIMPQFVRDILAGDTQHCQTALESLSSLAKKGDESMWRPWIGAVLVACVEALKRSPEGGIGGHEAAMECISAINVGMPGLAAPLVPMQVDALLSSAEYGRRSLLALAEETAVTLLCECNPSLAIDIMESAICRAQAPVLQAALRIAARVVKRFSTEVITQNARRLVAPMLPHMNHVDADVRKSVVFAVVALYQVVGAELRQYLEPLTASQHKLVAIYLERSNAQNQPPCT